MSDLSASAPGDNLGATPAPAKPASRWEDFIDIFYAPSAVFRRRENGNFFIPLAVITIVCGVLFYLNSGALQPMSAADALATEPVESA